MYTVIFDYLYVEDLFYYKNELKYKFLLLIFNLKSTYFFRF